MYCSSNISIAFRYGAEKKLCGFLMETLFLFTKMHVNFCFSTDSIDFFFIGKFMISSLYFFKRQCSQSQILDGAERERVRSDPRNFAKSGDGNGSENRQ